MASIYIIEDDMIIAADISMQLNKLGHTVTGISIRAEDALASFTQNKPDMVLMDINLGGRMDGIEASSEILKHYQIPVVFLTSNSDDATFQRALKTKPYAFISKPFQKADLERNIMVVLARIELEKEESESSEDQVSIMNDRLFLRSKDMMVKVRIQDILYVEADRNYCTVHTVEDKYFLTISLGKFSVHLTEDHFHKVHRSYMVNLNKIDAVNDKQEFLQIKGATIPVSRRMRPVLAQKLKFI